jgi:hypothetical protein
MAVDTTAQRGARGCVLISEGVRRSSAGRGCAAARRMQVFTAAGDSPSAPGCPAAACRRSTPPPPAHHHNPHSCVPRAPPHVLDPHACQPSRLPAAGTPPAAPAAGRCAYRLPTSAYSWLKPACVAADPDLQRYVGRSGGRHRHRDRVQQVLPGVRAGRAQRQLAACEPRRGRRSEAGPRRGGAKGAWCEQRVVARGTAAAAQRAARGLPVQGPSRPSRRAPGSATRDAAAPSSSRAASRPKPGLASNAAQHIRGGVPVSTMGLRKPASMRDSAAAV